MPTVTNKNSCISSVLSEREPMLTLKYHRLDQHSATASLSGFTVLYAKAR